MIRRSLQVRLYCGDFSLDCCVYEIASNVADKKLPCELL
jgi:hypothetical protein